MSGMKGWHWVLAVFSSANISYVGYCRLMFMSWVSLRLSLSERCYRACVVLNVLGSRNKARAFHGPIKVCLQQLKDFPLTPSSIDHYKTFILQDQTFLYHLGSGNNWNFLEQRQPFTIRTYKKTKFKLLRVNIVCVVTSGSRNLMITVADIAVIIILVTNWNPYLQS